MEKKPPKNNVNAHEYGLAYKVTFNVYLKNYCFIKN